MTTKQDPEVKALRSIARTLEALPREARFRTLAFLVSREAGVGTCDAAEWLYSLAREAREH